MTKQRSVGEGDYEAGRRYDKAATDFVQKHPDKVKVAAKNAKDAMNSSERDELDRAARKGASHSKGEDPAIKRK